MNERVAIMGATGHTGGFVAAELHRRGLTPVPCGRSTDLDRAFRGADAVINCAGPFASTADPVIGSAIGAGIPYLDVTAELEAVTDIFDRYAGAGIPIAPAAAFFGGLGDLLATAAMGRWPAAERLTIAYALSGWRPTPGTRATGRVSAERRGGRRIVYSGRRLRFRTREAPRTEWSFPAPIGSRPVVGEFTTADSATIPTHLDTPEIATYMSSNAVDDLHAADDSGPTAVDERGRSAQTFLVEVVASSEGTERRASAAGRDIYAVTAPLVVEAAVRVLSGEGDAAGVASVGARFEAKDFLHSLAPEHLTLE
ncbi:saccharopine dehydrogenase family protein [Glycomyces xiaoerkulensis]|uniref:saccharopine dehydrogenase n=1 Tax=Glycomyces xiaoerkulensis TaxID=2038139 RepID=UPI0018E4CD0D|nr:saccharopine dehydrogenase [Glycomyces xiaoerkulensis]